MSCAQQELCHNDCQTTGCTYKIQRFTIQAVDTSSSTSPKSTWPEFETPVKKSLPRCQFRFGQFPWHHHPRLRYRSWIQAVRNLFLVSADTKLFRKLMKSQFGGFEEERRRHLNSFPETIHPFSDFRWAWDILLSITLIVTLVLQPLQIAFYSDSMAQLDSALINASASFVFLIDIVLNFRTGYIGSDSDEVILNPRQTALHYFRTWFWIDFISTIPFDLIYITIQDLDSKAHFYFKFFRLLELLKILRLARIVRYLSKILQANNIQPTYIRLINLLTLLFLILHWLACLHYLVADLAHSSEKRLGDTRSWVSTMALWDHPVYEKYLHCVLRALSNMGCLGYGYQAPLSPEDVICTIISILIGATWFALFIANVSNIVLNLDGSHKKYDETLSHILDYMKFKHMPSELQERVESYFEQRYRHNLFNEEEILSNLSSVLRRELQMFNCQHLVRRVPIFQKIPNEVVQEIVGALKAEVFLPRDVILWENTLGDSMYFIQRGAVEVLTTSGRVVSHLFDGNFFGEVALLTNERRRVATVVATTRSEIYSLHLSDFQRIVHMYPEVFDEILAIAKDRARKITMEHNRAKCTGSETIRKLNEPQFRQHLRQAFHTDSEEAEGVSSEGSCGSSESSTHPIERSLKEILKMQPTNGCQEGSRIYGVSTNGESTSTSASDTSFATFVFGRASRAKFHEPSD